MSQITCIIDTSSYINLDSFPYFKGTLLNMLSRKVTFRISSEVHYEITKPEHYTSTMQPKQTVGNSVYHPMIHGINEYHNILIGGQRTREQGSKGEIDNFVVMLDGFLKKRHRHNIVLLTDDEKSLKGLLLDPIAAFPFCRVWSSFDVVLFLYLSMKEFTIDAAKNAIQHLHAVTSSDDIKMDKEKNAEREKRRRQYIRLLDKVSSLKQKL